MLAFAGCGGGGGGVSTPTSTPGPTPVATSIGGSCTALSYRPNYYGLPDPSNNDGSPNVYNFWRQFPISVYIPAGANAAFRASTLAGFDQWVEATNGRVSYELVSSATGADIVVSYVVQDPNSDTLGITTVTYNPSKHYIISAKMALSFYTTAQTSNANAANQSIAAHEFGHAIGISDHSPFSDDLMYPTLQSARQDVTTRDLNTLKTVYCNNFSTRSVSRVKEEGLTKTIVIRN